MSMHTSIMIHPWSDPAAGIDAYKRDDYIVVKVGDVLTIWFSPEQAAKLSVLLAVPRTEESFEDEVDERITRIEEANV